MLLDKRYYYENGAIVVETDLYSRVIYNVSNDKLSAVFNGTPFITSYALAGEKEMHTECHPTFRYNGKPLQDCQVRRVKMLGRRQSVEIEFEGGKIFYELFLDKSVNGIFASYEFVGEGQLSLAINTCLAFKDFTTDDNKVFENENVVFACSNPCLYIPENTVMCFDIDKTAHAFFAFGEKPDGRERIANFNKYRENCSLEIASVKLPNEKLSQEKLAMYYSAFFCALENYKEKGEYKGFMAGHNYLLPMRTYYRDSYFTTLPMYNGYTNLVRNQIVTLMRGISESGTCPSAVEYGFKGWWGNHYDSPSFLVIMLYDYVKNTGDESILFETFSGGQNSIEKAVAVLNKMSEYVDETHLIYKEGRFNRRDWADEINREGYVSYDNILYARALYSMSKIFGIVGNKDKKLLYFNEYTSVKNAINDILWDEDLGYYINYKSPNHVEKNLSIDTVYAAIYRIADEKRARKMLLNMENILETRNNHEQKAGDYGVMCVYPFYTDIYGIYNKSSQPYYYHNGGNWPYQSAMYAYAKKMYGMEYEYALTSWFDYNVKKGNYTPIEFYSSVQPDGSLIQAWSGVAAFVMFDEDASFWKE